MRGCWRPDSTKLRQKDPKRGEARTVCSLGNSVPWRALFRSPTRTPLDILGSPAPHAFLEFFSLTVQEREGSRAQVASSSALPLSACQIHGLPRGHRAGLPTPCGPGPPGQSGDGHRLRTEVQAQSQIRSCGSLRAPVSRRERHTRRQPSRRTAEVGRSKATFRESGTPVAPRKMPCYLGFCWPASHSHRSSSCGLSPLFIMEGNTHFTACSVKMEVRLFSIRVQGVPSPSGTPPPPEASLGDPCAVEGTSWLLLSVGTESSSHQRERGTVWRASVNRKALIYKVLRNISL